MAESLQTETKANCALALASRLLISMAKHKLITVDVAARIAHDAGDLAERAGGGDTEAEMLMDELIGAINRLRD